MRVGSIIAVCVLAAALAGCIPSDRGDDELTQVAPTLTPGELTEQWMKLAKAPEENIEDDLRNQITDQLAAMGPTTLIPMIELLGDSDSSDLTKLFAIQCITRHMTPVYLPNLMPLVEEPHDSVTRACALTMIGHIEDPQVMPILRRAYEDPDPRLSFAGLSGLSIQGDVEARDKLKAMYWQPDSSPERRAEVVRVVLRAPNSTDLEVLGDAISAPETDEAARLIIVNMFGGMGDSSLVGSIEESMTLESVGEGYAELAQAAITAIQARESAAASAEVTDDSAAPEEAEADESR